MKYFVYMLSMLTIISLSTYSCGPSTKTEENTEQKGDEHPADHDHGDEHPADHDHGDEHPTDDSHEHPADSTGGDEHPTEDGTSANPVTIEKLAVAIQSFVDEESELKGGFFEVMDPTTNTKLKLKLSKIHDDKLASLGDGVHFACADFQNEDGTVYDLDIFMKGHDANTLETTEVSVHKKDGNARYTWQEQEGVWSKKSM